MEHKETRKKEKKKKKKKRGGLIVHSYNPRAGDKVFRVILRHTSSMRSAWATYDLLQKPKRKTRKEQNPEV